MATVGDYQHQPGTLFTQHLFQEAAAQKHRLGTVRETDDGRRYVYCQATAAAIEAGICVSKAVSPQDATVVTADIVYNIAGARKITLTLTGTPTLNLYRDGWMVIKAGASEGLGEMYKIRGNTADDDPVSGRCTFFLYDELKTLHSASTTVALYANPYDGVLINPAVADGDATTGERILAVTTRKVTASYYFWGQTWGIASVILDVPGAAGAEADERLLVPGTAEGQLGVEAAGTEPDQPVYGHILETADLTDGEGNLVFLMIS